MHCQGSLKTCVKEAMPSISKQIAIPQHWDPGVRPAADVGLGYCSPDNEAEADLRSGWILAVAICLWFTWAVDVH